CRVLPGAAAGPADHDTLTPPRWVGCRPRHRPPYLGSMSTPARGSRGPTNQRRRALPIVAAILTLAFAAAACTDNGGGNSASRTKEDPEVSGFAGQSLSMASRSPFVRPTASPAPAS